MINQKKNLLVFEDDDISRLNFERIESINFFFINPSAYFKNKTYTSNNYFYYGLDFNEFIYKNFSYFEKNYIKSLNILKKYDLEIIVKETISNLIIPIISIYFFSTYKLNKKQFYFIDNNSILEVNKDNFIKYFSKFLLYEGQLIFLRNKSQKQYFSRFIQYLNKLTLKLINDKSYIHLQDLNYGFKNLVKKEKKHLFITFNYLNKNNFFKSLKSLFEYLLFDRNHLSISIPITKKVNFKKLDLYLFDHIDTDLSKITSEAFNFLNYYSQNLKINFNKHIKQTFKAQFSLFHNLKWLDDLVFSSLSSKVYLASHSSHPLPQNKVSSFFLKELSRGFLDSSFASNIVIQSKETLNSYKKFNYDTQKKLIKRFVWGYSSNATEKNKGDGITLLHAATFKVGSFRPYIYESSNLYFKKLQKLCLIINSINGINLIIRPCINNDFKLQYYKEMLNEFNSNKISLSYSTPFVEDLSKSDCLISFSSTTIEEAILLNKKIILLTSNNEHQHFSKNKNIQHIDIFNIKENEFKNLVEELNNYKSKVEIEKNFKSINSIINE